MTDQEIRAKALDDVRARRREWADNQPVDPSTGAPVHPPALFGPIWDALEAIGQHVDRTGSWPDGEDK